MMPGRLADIKVLLATRFPLSSVENLRYAESSRCALTDVQWEIVVRLLQGWNVTQIARHLSRGEAKEGHYSNERAQRALKRAVPRNDVPSVPHLFLLFMKEYLGAAYTQSLHRDSYERLQRCVSRSTGTIWGTLSLIGDPANVHVGVNGIATRQSLSARRVQYHFATVRVALERAAYDMRVIRALCLGAASYERERHKMGVLGDKQRIFCPVTQSNTQI